MDFSSDDDDNDSIYENAFSAVLTSPVRAKESSQDLLKPSSIRRQSYGVSPSGVQLPANVPLRDVPGKIPGSGLKPTTSTIPKKTTALPGIITPRRPTGAPMTVPSLPTANSVKKPSTSVPQTATTPATITTATTTAISPAAATQSLQSPPHSIPVPTTTSTLPLIATLPPRPAAISKFASRSGQTKLSQPTQAMSTSRHVSSYSASKKDQLDLGDREPPPVTTYNMRNMAYSDDSDSLSINGDHNLNIQPEEVQASQSTIPGVRVDNDLLNTSTALSIGLNFDHFNTSINSAASVSGVEEHSDLHSTASSGDELNTSVTKIVKIIHGGDEDEDNLNFFSKKRSRETETTKKRARRGNITQAQIALNSALIGPRDDFKTDLDASVLPNQSVTSTIPRSVSEQHHSTFGDNSSHPAQSRPNSPRIAPISPFNQSRFAPLPGIPSACYYDHNLQRPLNATELLSLDINQNFNDLSIFSITPINSSLAGGSSLTLDSSLTSVIPSSLHHTKKSLISLTTTCDTPILSHSDTGKVLPVDKIYTNTSLAATTTTSAPSHLITSSIPAVNITHPAQGFQSIPLPSAVSVKPLVVNQKTLAPIKLPMMVDYEEYMIKYDEFMRNKSESISAETSTQAKKDDKPVKLRRQTRLFSATNIIKNSMDDFNPDIDNMWLYSHNLQDIQTPPIKQDSEGSYHHPQNSHTDSTSYSFIHPDNYIDNQILYTLSRLPLDHINLDKSTMALPPHDYGPTIIIPSHTHFKHLSINPPIQNKNTPPANDDLDETALLSSTRKRTRPAKVTSSITRSNQSSSDASPDSTDQTPNFIGVEDYCIKHNEDLIPPPNMRLFNFNDVAALRTSKLDQINRELHSTSNHTRHLLALPATTSLLSQLNDSNKRFKPNHYDHFYQQQDCSDLSSQDSALSHFDTFAMSDSLSSNDSLDCCLSHLITLTDHDIIHYLKNISNATYMKLLQQLTTVLNNPHDTDFITFQKYCNIFKIIDLVTYATPLHFSHYFSLPSTARNVIDITSSVDDYRSLLQRQLKVSFQGLSQQDQLNHLQDLASFQNNVNINTQSTTARSHKNLFPHHAEHFSHKELSPAVTHSLHSLGLTNSPKQSLAHLDLIDESYYKDQLTLRHTLPLTTTQDPNTINLRKNPLFASKAYSAMEHSALMQQYDHKHLLNSPLFLQQQPYVQVALVLPLNIRFFLQQYGVMCYTSFDPPTIAFRITTYHGEEDDDILQASDDDDSEDFEDESVGFGFSARLRRRAAAAKKRNSKKNKDNDDDSDADLLPSASNNDDDLADALRLAQKDTNPSNYSTMFILFHGYFNNRYTMPVKTTYAPEYLSLGSKPVPIINFTAFTIHSKLPSFRSATRYTLYLQHVYNIIVQQQIENITQLTKERSIVEVISKLRGVNEHLKLQQYQHKKQVSEVDEISSPSMKDPLLTSPALSIIQRAVNCSLSCDKDVTLMVDEDINDIDENCPRSPAQSPHTSLFRRKQLTNTPPPSLHQKAQLSLTASTSKAPLSSKLPQLNSSSDSLHGHEYSINHIDIDCTNREKMIKAKSTMKLNKKVITMLNEVNAIQDTRAALNHIVTSYHLKEIPSAISELPSFLDKFLRKGLLSSDLTHFLDGVGTKHQ